MPSFSSSAAFFRFFVQVAVVAVVVGRANLGVAAVAVPSSIVATAPAAPVNTSVPAQAHASVHHHGLHNKTTVVVHHARQLDMLMGSGSPLSSVVQPIEAIVGGNSNRGNNATSAPASNVEPVPAMNAANVANAPNVTRRGVVSSSSSSRRTHRGKNRMILPRSTEESQSVEYYDSRIRSYYSDLKRHSSTLSALAQKSYTTSPNDAAHQRQAYGELTSYHNSLLGFSALLKQLGAEKGLKYYDRSNSLETLLKDIVNLNKDTLSAVTLIVYNIPVLGKTLGPIVYEIKCILDDVLNAIENLVDALLNVLKPLLKPIIGGWFAVACRTGNGGLNLSACPH